MNQELVILLIALSAGLTAGYTTRVLARSPEGINFIKNQNLIISLIGTLAFPAILSVVVWGFINLIWWWVILSFLGVSLLVVPVLFGGGQRLPLMIKIQPILEIIVISLATYLWVKPYL